jgi:hypothetical protein
MRQLRWTPTDVSTIGKDLFSNFLLEEFQPFAEPPFAMLKANRRQHDCRRGFEAW